MLLEVPGLTPFLGTLSHNHVDAYIVGGAALAVLIALCRRKWRGDQGNGRSARRVLIRQALNGAVIVVFALIVLTVASVELLHVLTSFKAGEMALAGFIGLIFASGELVDGS